MTNDPKDGASEPISDTLALFRDAERKLDTAFRQALPLLLQRGVLWIDKSLRDSGYGSSSNTPKWHHAFARSWMDERGSACIVLDVFAMEPFDVLWGVPLHWQLKTFSEPRILQGRAAYSQGSVKLEKTLLNGFELFLVGCIDREASRIDRKL